MNTEQTTPNEAPTTDVALPTTDVHPDLATAAVAAVDVVETAVDADVAEQAAASVEAAADTGAESATSALPLQLDLTNPDRQAAMIALLTDRVANQQGVEIEMDVIRSFIHASEDFAWAWTNAIAQSVLTEGVDSPAAYRAAARVMHNLFGYNAMALRAFAPTQANYKRLGGNVYIVNDVQSTLAAYDDFLATMQRGERKSQMVEFITQQKAFPAVATFYADGLTDDNRDGLTFVPTALIARS